MTGTEFRPFAPAERDELRRIRLAGLAECPLAFASTHAYEAAQPASFWEGWLERSPPFGAFEGATAVGIAGLSRATLPNLAHRGSLGAMYVAPSHRGSGIADRLVEAVAARAVAQGIAQLHLTVNPGNPRAVRFYRRMGFTDYGIEPRGMTCAGTYHDLILMVRLLT
jgi:ribosomal protein S18 acetylase RimI-like enzyme